MKLAKQDRCTGRQGTSRVRTNFTDVCGSRPLYRFDDSSRFVHLDSHRAPSQFPTWPSGTFAIYINMLGLIYMEQSDVKLRCSRKSGDRGSWFSKDGTGCHCKTFFYCSKIRLVVLSNWNFYSRFDFFSCGINSWKVVVNKVEMWNFILVCLKKRRILIQWLLRFNFWRNVEKDKKKIILELLKDFLLGAIKYIEWRSSG